jgi:methylenetetrahydrofolate dehydrogenase (NADP+) / methenyltetrahydrofolate cyclohydrolase
MAAKIIDGKAIASQIKSELKEKVAALNAEGIQVTLAVILVGENPASQVYVRNKIKACEQCGIQNREILLPAEVSEEELLRTVDELNADRSVNGILVQLPLPGQIDEQRVIRRIDPLKDVDGFHPQSVGALSIGLSGFVSCTPAGIIELLHRSGICCDGKECVIAGRSNIVGKPMGMLMLRENATVTTAHSHTRDLAAVCRRADILITAIGKPKFFGREYVKEGAVVIDCGINRDENGRLCGDVDYEDVLPVAGAITPVPGGVGPMTIAMLMSNCVEAIALQNA